MEWLTSLLRGHGSIARGDELAAVDAWPCFGRPVLEITNRILGPAGTPVHLTLKDTNGRDKLVSILRELPGATSAHNTGADLEDSVQQTCYAMDALGAMEQALRDRDTRILELQRQQEQLAKIKDDEIAKLRVHLQVCLRVQGFSAGGVLQGT